MIEIFMKIVYLCIFHVARRSTFLARTTTEENQMTRSRSRKPPCSPSLFVATLLAVHGQYKFSPTCTEQMETSLCGFPAAILPLCDRNEIERDSRRKGREKKRRSFSTMLQAETASLRRQELRQTLVRVKYTRYSRLRLTLVRLICWKNHLVINLGDMHVEKEQVPGKLFSGIYGGICS